MARNWIQLTQICINMCCTYMKAIWVSFYVLAAVCGSGSCMCTAYTDIYCTLCFGMFARGWISNPNNSIYTRGVMLYQNRKLNLHRMYHSSRSCCRTLLLLACLYDWNIGWLVPPGLALYRYFVNDVFFSIIPDFIKFEEIKWYMRQRTPYFQKELWTYIYCISMRVSNSDLCSVKRFIGSTVRFAIRLGRPRFRM